MSISNYVEQFKSNFTNGLFKLSGKTWWKYIIVYLLQFIITLVAAVPLIFTLIDVEALGELFSDPNSMGRKLEENPELLFSVLGENPDYTALIIGGSLFMIVVILLASWMQNIYFKINENEILKSGNDLGRILGVSFDRKVVTIIGAMFVMIVIYLIIYAAVILLFTVHWSIGVLAFLAMLLVYMKFLLILPAIVHGDHGITSSIRFSFETITWRRATILILIGIATTIGLTIVAVLIGLLSFVLLLIPFLGFILYYAIQIAFSGILYSLMYGAMSGLYYRYANVEYESKELDISAHLVE